MGNGVVEDNYQISLNYTSPAVMDRRLWLNYRGRKKTKRNELDFTGRHSVSYLLWFTACSYHSPGNEDGLVRVDSVIGLLCSGQLVISVRVTECGRRGGSESAPTDPWSLAGQGDRSSKVSPQHVCMCVCVLTEARLPWQHHPDRMCGYAFVGGWLGAVAMVRYFCIFLICVSRCTHTHYYYVGLMWCVCVFARPCKCWCSTRVQMWHPSRCWTATPSHRWKRRS